MEEKIINKSKDGYYYPSNQKALENYIEGGGKLINIKFNESFGVLDFSTPIMKRYLASHKKIDNLRFNNITIKGDVNDKVSLATCYIDNCKFENFNMADSQLTHTTFDGNTFTNCKVNRNFIYHNHFKKCNFNKCEFKNNKLEKNFFKDLAFENAEILDNELNENYLVNLEFFSTNKVHNNKMKKCYITPKTLIDVSKVANVDKPIILKENIELLDEGKLNDMENIFLNDNKEMQTQSEINNKLELKNAIIKEDVEQLPVSKDVAKKISNSEEKKIAKKTKKYAKYNKTQNKNDSNIKPTTTNTNLDSNKEKDIEKLSSSFANQIETFAEQGKKGIIFSLADIIIIATNTIRKINAKKIAIKQYNKDHNIITEKEKLNQEIKNKNREIKTLNQQRKIAGKNNELSEKIEEELKKHKIDREQLKVKVRDRTLER